LNAYDFAQTVETARSPGCFREIDPITSKLVGLHPSSRTVALTWAGYSVTHYAVTAWLDRTVEATDSRAWRIVRGAWHVLTIANSAQIVSRNADLGLQPFGGAHHCEPVSCQPGQECPMLPHHH
jgi:hypothetical protein